MNTTTKLEALNTIISVAGEPPLPSVDPSLSADAAIALRFLDESLREVLMEQWNFNTERRTIEADGDGEVNLPANCFLAYIDRSKDNYSNEYTQRGHRLFDATDGTYTINADLNVTMILGFDFEECPEFIRQYAMVKAARKFQDRRLGERELHQYTQEDEIMAKGRARGADDLDADYSIFDHPSVGEVIHRRGYPYRPNG